MLPYYELDFAGAPEIVREVCVGPSSNTDLTYRAVADLLIREGFTAWTVHQSRVPYRVF